VKLRVVVVASVLVLSAGCTRGERSRPYHKPERITLAPSRVTRAVGEIHYFTATAHYPGSATRNVTQEVHYRSSDEAVVRAPNAAGKRSRVEAVGPGTATISATDLWSGVSSSDAGADATFIVVGALERIELTPRTVSRALGEPQSFRATGFYAGGGTRNLTQGLAYASSDRTVAVAPNEAGRRSRVETVAPGRVTISATDPVSGVSTTASSGDAVLTIYPAPSKSPPRPTP
jgi:uncharacterized protein YjdB